MNFQPCVKSQDLTPEDNRLRFLIRALLGIVIISQTTSLSAADYSYRRSTKPSAASGLGAFLQGLNQGQQMRVQNQLAQQELMLQQQVVNQIAYERERAAEAEMQALRVQRQASMARVIRDILNPFFDSLESLMDGITLYTEGLETSKVYTINNWMLYAALNNKIFQAVEKIEDGADAANDIKDTGGGISLGLKKHFSKGLKNFHDGLEHEVAGFESGAVFWVAKKKFDQAKAEKIIGLRGMLKGLEEVRGLDVEQIYAVTNRDIVFKLEGIEKMLEVILDANERMRGNIPTIADYYAAKKRFERTKDMAQNKIDELDQSSKVDERLPHT